MVVPRLMAMPTAGPARGARDRERRPEEGDDQARGGKRQLHRPLDLELLGVVPGVSQRSDVSAQLVERHLFRVLRLDQKIAGRLGDGREAELFESQVAASSSGSIWMLAPPRNAHGGPWGSSGRCRR